MIVLSEVPLTGVEHFCEKLRQKIEQTTFSNGPDSIKLTLSLGYATFDAQNAESVTAREIVRRADVALYQAKNTGRNRVVAYNEKFDRLHRLEKSPVMEVLDRKRKTA